MSMIKNRRIIYSVFIIALISLIFCILPALGRYKNETTLSSDIRVWSGKVASSYRSGNGTKANPYVISSAEELAYLSENLKTTDYKGKYFKIINDIIINKGYFIYENNVLKYSLNGNIYYVNEDKYYNSQDFTQDEVGNLNVFPSLSNFKGYLDGNFKTIYGYYANESLFNQISGELTSLYINNAFVNGKSILANKIIDGSINNIYIEGTLVGQSFDSNNINEIDVDSNYNDINLPIEGIFASYIDNSTATNIINRSKIYSGCITGSLFGYAHDVNIDSSYSYADNQSYKSSFIGILKGNNTINNVYNIGVINNGLIGYLIDADLTIDNSFIVDSNYFVANSSNSNITAQNMYYVGNLLNNLVSATAVTEANLKDKTYLNSYNEFVSLNNLKSNNQNKWIFPVDAYPILYFDHISNGSKLYINRNYYDSYSLFVDDNYVSSNIVISIVDDNELLETNKYYYVSNSNEILSISELNNISWNEYNEPISIQNEGSYIIYAKIVDSLGNISYINSDNLILDKTNPVVNIDFNNNQYSDINNSTLYINKNENIVISAYDNSAASVSINYYLANDFINNLNDIEWENYVNNITITNNGKYVVYAKVTDLAGNISYASTPLIIYDGYVVSDLKPLGFSSGNIITKNSTITMSINYQSSNEQDFKHYLVSNKNLPNNVRFILIDKTNNNVYSYSINSNDVINIDNKYYYALDLFSLVGKKSNVSYTDNSSQSEAFELYVDFSNATITNDISNVYLNVIGLDENMSIIRPYVNEESFTVLSSENQKVNHTLTTNYRGSINYNTDSISNITLYSNIVNNGSIDTSISDKTTGVIINILDENNNIISKENYKSLTFSAFDKIYAPDALGNIKINLSSNQTSSFILKITTFKSQNNLLDGNYSIVLTPYLSYDGEIIFSQNNSSRVIIPLINSSQEKSYTYSYDVINNSNTVFTKPEDINLDLDVMVSGLNRPNIKYSLYRKNILSAYNQEYTLIDIQDYTTTELDKYVDKVYYLARKAKLYTNNKSLNNMKLTLSSQDMPKGNYKITFDLYEDNEFINSINKYFIVR